MPGDRAVIEGLNRAILTQFTVAAESAAAEQAAIEGGQPQEQPQAPEQPQLPSPPSGMGVGQGGAPESINPQTNPVGAAGGLPLGLSS